MAAPKTITRAAGDTFQMAQPGPFQQQPDVDKLAVAIQQLQDSLNELITRYNAHTHGGVTVGAGSTGVSSSLVNGTAQAAANLFVAAAS